MNEQLAARYADDLRATLGHAGRMISFSKTLFRERHPDHAAVFNANVCLEEGKIWHGDLDLTVDEPQLQALSERIGEAVYVLYESDARFDREDEPLLKEAVFSVVPSGHYRFDFRSIERVRDGTLRHRPNPPDTRPRWHWRVLRHRPRLWRFWRIELKPISRADPWPESSARLLYLGRRAREAPFLVLGAVWAARRRTLGLELTWYPAVESDERAAPRALLDLSFERRVGRCKVWFRLLIWPAFMHEVLVGYRSRG